MVERNIFASGKVVEFDRDFDFEVDGEALNVNVHFTKYDRCIIVEMPKTRMYSKILMLDGQSSGQKDGGYVADDDGGAVDIKLFFIPREAGFAATRFMASNILVPSKNELDELVNNVDVDYSMDKMFGPVEIGNAGINQKANAWEIDTRILYGGSLFTNRASACYAIGAVRS